MWSAQKRRCRLAVQAPVSETRYVPWGAAEDLSQDRRGRQLCHPRSLRPEEGQSREEPTVVWQHGRHPKASPADASETVHQRVWSTLSAATATASRRAQRSNRPAPRLSSPRGGSVCGRRIARKMGEAQSANSVPARVGEAAVWGGDEEIAAPSQTPSGVGGQRRVEDAERALGVGDPSA